jgi:hypothetical protein
MLPVPDADRPIDVFEFVQLYVVPLTAPEKVTAAVVAPLHNVWSAAAATVGVGFTVIVKVSATPAQLLADGVTMIVAVAAVVPVLVAVNAPMLPVPDADRPIAVFEFVQLYVVPLTAPEKVTAAVVAPLHNVWSAAAATVGVGFTVIVNVSATPAQLLANGVTMIVAVAAVVPEFVAVNAPMLPVPDADRPIAVFEFVQL